MDEGNEKRLEKVLTVVVIGLLCCAFTAGFLLGKKSQFNTSRDFYNEYVMFNCYCSSPLIYEDGKVFYGRPTLNPAWDGVNEWHEQNNFSLVS